MFIGIGKMQDFDKAFQTRGFKMFEDGLQVKGGSSKCHRHSCFISLTVLESSVCSIVVCIGGIPSTWL